MAAIAAEILETLVKAIEERLPLGALEGPTFQGIRDRSLDIAFTGFDLTLAVGKAGEILGVRVHQTNYILAKVTPKDASLLLTLRGDESSKTARSEKLLTIEEVDTYRRLLGVVMWTGRTCSLIAEELSELASAMSCPTVADAKRLAKLLEFVAANHEELGIWIRKLDSPPEEHCSLFWADGSLQNRGSRTQGGHLVALGTMTADGCRADCNVVSWISSGIKRVCTSTFDSETLSVSRASDDGVSAALVFQELFFGRLPSITERVMIGFTGGADERTVRVIGFSDGGGTVSTVLSSKVTTPNKRRAADVASLREMYSDTSKDSLSHIQGERNPSDPLTKKFVLDSFKKVSSTLYLLWNLCHNGIWIR